MNYLQLEKPFERLGFKAGLLYAVRGKQLFRFHPWPELMAEQRLEDGRWKPLFGAKRDSVCRSIETQFDPRNSGLYRMAGFWWSKRTGQGYFDWALFPFRRRRDFAAICVQRFSASVPPRLRQAAEKMRFGFITSLELFRHVPVAVDLVTHDPLIAVCLARHWRFAAVGHKAWPEVSRVVRLRRRDILGWIGFPATDAAVNALRRLRIDTTEAGSVVPVLRDLMKCLNDHAVRNNLVRMPSIEPELVRLLANPRTRRWISPSGLRRYARLKGGKIYRISHVLEEVSNWVELGLIKSDSELPISRIVTLHNRLLRASRSPEALKRLVPDLPFPPWPVVGLEGAPRIRSVHALLGEGALMGHCAGTLGYLVRAMRGEVAFFQITSPVRATLALGCREGVWAVEDVRAQRNAEITASDRDQILRPFEGLLNAGGAG